LAGLREKWRQVKTSCDNKYSKYLHHQIWKNKCLQIKEELNIWIKKNHWMGFFKWH
jgi:hypothetical protein